VIAAFGGRLKGDEFEFLSRIIASMQSMTSCRYKRHWSNIAVNQERYEFTSRPADPNASRISAPIAASAVAA
jgi:hypothetical protein